MTSAISGVNFSGYGSIKVNSYNGKNTGATISYTTQTYDDNINYDNVETYGNMHQEEKIELDKNNFFENKYFKSGFSNAIFYIGTALFDKKNIEYFLGSIKESGRLTPKLSTSKSTILFFVTFGSTVFKLITGEITGKDAVISFTEGLSKPLIKNFIENDVVYKTQMEYIKALYPEIKADEFDMKLSRLGKVDDAIDAIDKENFKSTTVFANEAFKGHVYGSLAKMGASIGVDWVASVGVNIIKGFLNDGEFHLDELKLGSTFLKSSCKSVCATACEMCFIWAGPGGRKAAKTFGSIVGATIGEWLVDVFNTGENGEAWCAAAGAGIVVGATASGIIATLLITGSSIAISVPVAGWIVGGAIIVGAAVGALVIWLAKVISGG